MKEHEFRAWLEQGGAQSRQARDTRVSAIRTIERKLEALGMKYQDIDEAWEADKFETLQEHLRKMREDARDGGQDYRILMPDSETPHHRLSDYGSWLGQYGQFLAGETPKADVVPTVGRLAGKRAIITGGGSGFGAGMAEAFVSEGATVSVLDLNSDAAHQTAARLGPRGLAVRCDVADGRDLAHAVAQSVEVMGGLDIVVNNAGYSHPNRPMSEVDEDVFDRMFAVNVKAIYLMTNLVVPHLRKAGGGNILNIGSTAGIRPRPGLTWYNATKGAVNLVSKSMAVELAPDNIRVNCIAPVIGTTGMLETFMGGPDTPETRARFVSTIPLARMSTPRDIANAALYLVSDDADFVTGVVLEVDGGRCI